MKYDQNLYPFKSQRITIKNHRIHYIDEGVGQVILFSHAALGSSFMYREFIKRLSQKFRCIALDYPGFGLSEPHADYRYDIASQSQVLASFIQALHLENVILLGHDTGGPSAFKVAVDQPEMVQGLILTDTIIFPVYEYRKIDRMLKIVGSGIFSELNAYTNLLVRLTFRFGVKSRKLTKAEWRQYLQLFASRPHRRRITKMLHSLKDNASIMQHIKNGFETTINKKPCLLIYGENDPVTQLGIAARIHAMMPHSKLCLIENEGHFPHEGKPLEMCKLMEDWLGQLAPELVRSNTH
ncbi:alpha/beta fold hydrolase [Fulvivirgaceae bacterium BMA12]|uniref:Alpha/beta fold hydrolase n=1 Tax=Agaribacillus aureus TaxID=3051825 RepID=A0ABT8LA60_9BACT|nr:alpha/beta fold hydrolase [Fulvivirgaceae bacterium BMA12]